MDVFNESPTYINFLKIKNNEYKSKISLNENLFNENELVVKICCDHGF